MGGRRNRELQRQAQGQADKQFDYNTELQREALAKYEARQADYEQMDFFNPYDNMQNYYADLKNAYEGMENRFEELQVSTAAADFQMEQSAQQRSDILQALTGSAGTSGIAGLAQTLANQGVMAARQASVDIAQQQRQNALMAAQAGQQIDQQQRQTDMQIQQAVAQGAASADMAERGGAAMVQSAEMGRQSTLLGIEYGGMAGANAGVQSAYANQMAGFGAQASMLNSQLAFTGQMIETGASFIPKPG